MSVLNTGEKENIESEKLLKLFMQQTIHHTQQVRFRNQTYIPHQKFPKLLIDL